MGTDRIARICVVALMALAAVACKKPAEGGVHLDDVQGAFGKADWKSSPFAPIDAAKFSAQKCVGSSIEGVDVVLCEFGSEEAKLRGKHAVESWVAEAVTGAALDNGRTVLGLADRARADPNGKIIHQVTKAYRAIK